MASRPVVNMDNFEEGRIMYVAGAFLNTRDRF